MNNEDFRSKFQGGDLTIGTFVKIGDLSVIEMLTDSAIDFVVLDQEHAPLDRRSLDILLFAARSRGLPALVRVPTSEPSVILAALDGGAAGILLPHVGDAATARRAAAACRYRAGRGYSGAVRSTRNRGAMREAIAAVDREIVVIAQIEDAAAVDRAAEIAACEGIDGLFIGRGDLAVSMRAASSDAPEIWMAARSIAAAARQHGKAICAFAAGWPEADRLIDLGARAIVLGSDQSYLKAKASQIVTEAALRCERLTPEGT
ncbi:2-keto-3-deoxy-L-rhamnonate aldolase RhmA [Hephaestia caeni]|uniref:2-keto-3-deoxy-L-rhamnonate aldolase RhmA n=1 Tax=Hephaestia caeni TaxID=645617 RepID=A0A397NHW6_9SPHN|nr:aldolase/citrate lyase family protein [Hephaestia caeni]RIA37100.1 2-keto-3-deoxy-L-rhamnonate aldolase RhmA [Hephaestia caeni]